MIYLFNSLRRSFTAATSAEESESEARNSSREKIGYVTFSSVEKMPYIGTVFAGQPCTQSLRDQRRWILSLPIRGKVYGDDNCIRAVIEKRKSLFAAGIVHVEDEFYPGEAVALYAASSLEDGKNEDNELARFIVNFSSEELKR